MAHVQAKRTSRRKPASFPYFAPLVLLRRIALPSFLFLSLSGAICQVLQDVEYMFLSVPHPWDSHLVDPMLHALHRQGRAGLRPPQP